MYLNHITIQNNTQNSTAKKQYSNARKTSVHTEVPTSTQFYNKPRKHTDYSATVPSKEYLEETGFEL
jgi:peptide methionine sulfoxide reductase MsrA